MGRPAGSRNKTMKLNGQPCSLTFLLRQMENTELEMRERIDCAKAILPYQHRKMPTAIDLTGDVALQVTAIERIICR